MKPGNSRPTHALDVIEVRVARRTVASPMAIAPARTAFDARGVEGNASAMAAFERGTLAAKWGPRHRRSDRTPAPEGPIIAQEPGTRGGRRRWPAARQRGRRAAVATRTQPSAKASPRRT